MILIFQLDKCSSELGKIFINEICELVTCQNSLILKNADITPCIDEARIHIPQGCVTKKIGIVMKEAGRAYYLSVACSFNINQLSLNS